MRERKILFRVLGNTPGFWRYLFEPGGQYPEEGTKMQGTKVLETSMPNKTQNSGQSVRYECEVCGKTTTFKNVLKEDNRSIVLCKKHFRRSVLDL